MSPVFLRSLLIATRTPTRRIIAIVALCALCAGVSQAQMNPGSVRERYDKQTKGSSLDEYVTKLGSDDPQERLEGVKSLGEAKDKKATQYLIQAVGDPDERVQVKAIETLGELRASDATSVLVQHLFIRTTRPEMKRLILASLGKIGDPSAAKPIVEFLQRDLDDATRGTAIYALGDIGSTDASATLEQLSKNDPNPTLRRLSREALSKVQIHRDAQAKEVKEPLETFLPKEPPPPAQ